MFDVTGKIKDFSVDFVTGKANITFSINEKNDVIKCFDELSQCEKLSIKIAKYRKKRSLNANSYFWLLCGKLSEKMGIPKIDIYREYIRNIGVFRMVEINEKAVDTLITAWQLNGIGWLAERVDKSKIDGFVIVCLYYGSSTYNTQQMSLLIDNVVQDCKEQGIETLTPTELETLKTEWVKDEIQAQKGG